MATLATPCAPKPRICLMPASRGSPKLWRKRRSAMTAPPNSRAKISTFWPVKD
jgi:hypothetical protein